MVVSGVVSRTTVAITIGALICLHRTSPGPTSEVLTIKL